MNTSIRLLICCIVSTQIINTIDNPHFYRANFFWGEPRLELPWLTTLEINGATGTTTQSRNADGHKTALFNLYGPFALQHLAAGLSGLETSNPLDAILIQLNNLPDNGSFGNLLFKGHFRTTEAFVNFQQNFCLGFFLQLYLPIRNLTLRHTTSYTDLSPTDGQGPIVTTPVWQTFLHNLDAILQRHGRRLNNGQSVTDFGDFSILGGWTWNYQDTCDFDYIDLSSKIGFLLPTGRDKKPGLIFSLPTGYNGFTGVPVKFQGSFGLFDWLTMGCDIGALFFFDKTKEIFLKTDPRQNGLIKLGKATAEIQQGPIWDLAAYAKADHVVHGLSFLFGYTYTKQDKTIICPQETFNFTSSSILLADEEFKSWRMHVIHFMVEYDFAERGATIGSRVGFFYNMVVGGNRIFNTNVKHGYVGIDALFDF